MITPAKIPNALIGIKGLKAFARNPTEVVLDVTNVALKALLQVYAILLFFDDRITVFSFWLYRQASNKTKTSSAAIPRTIKIDKVFILLKYVTLNIPSVIRAVIGNEKTINSIIIVLKNIDCI
jgi:hypothetical protein